MIAIDMIMSYEEQNSVRMNVLSKLIEAGANLDLQNTEVKKYSVYNYIMLCFTKKLKPIGRDGFYVGRLQLQS